LATSASQDALRIALEVFIGLVLSFVVVETVTMEKFFLKSSNLLPAPVAKARRGPRASVQKF
jgi:hypothetical protein